MESAAAVKRIDPAIAVVLGGPHPSALPAETLALIPGADFVIAGE